MPMYVCVGVVAHIFSKPNDFLYPAGFARSLCFSIYFSSRFITNQSLKAQWGYKAIHRDEITFKKGAVVTFIRQDVNNKDWLIVKTRRGTVGLVPATYFRSTKSAKNTNAESTGSCSKSNKCKTDDNNCKSSDNVQRTDIRIRIIQEMVQTEQVSIHTHKFKFYYLHTHVDTHNQQYNKKLSVLMDSYKKPLEAMLNEQPLLEQAEIDLLFKSVPVILTMSSAFLTGLKRAKCKNIGKLFLEFAPCLRAYSPFLGSYMASIQTLQAIQRDKARKSKWLVFLVGVSSICCLLLAWKIEKTLISFNSNIPLKQQRPRGHTTWSSC